MQKNLWHGALALFVQLTMLALTGCGGGSSSPPPPPPPATTYTVGGNVSGLVANESVTLLNNGGDALIVPGNGEFTFSTNQNADSAYAVTVQSHTPGVACAMSNGSGSVGSSNVTSVSVSCAAGTATILYSFGSGPTDGTNPAAGLIMDSAGNLYGATNGGGANGFGTVFKISADGAETVLHSFAGSPTDGMNPLAGLIMDSAGNLYGTTSSGGANGDGTVFKISATGTETVLHSFAGLPSDGRKANAGLTMDSAGNLSTTEAGGLGAYDFGTVFKISVDGTESILFSFSGVDGGEPEAGLIMDSAGNLYGTTSSGGTATLLTSGEVFKISPAGAETVLHFFTGGITPAITDGGYPRAGLIIDSAGNLYGTTSLGGANDEGTVFKISAAGSLSILHSFAGATTDGNEPLGGLIVDSAGNLYGTSAVGGANDAGTAFKIN